MSFPEWIAIAVIALIVGGAVFYIVRAKKKGQKCIGCPYAKECSKKCACNINIADEKKEDKK